MEGVWRPSRTGPYAYDGTLYCALLACPEQVPDPHAILADLEDELRALLARRAHHERTSGSTSLANRRRLEAASSKGMPP